MSARKELTLFALSLTGGHLIPEQVGARLDRLIGDVEAEQDAKVLAEAADKLALELTPGQPGAGPGFLLALRLSVRALRRMADEAAVNVPAAGQDDTSTAEADFFQPGHGYTHRDGSDFLTVAVTTHPVTREPRAFGWIIRNGWHEGAALDPDDWSQYDGCAPPAPADCYAGTRGEPGPVNQ